MRRGVIRLHDVHVRYTMHIMQTLAGSSLEGGMGTKRQKTETSQKRNAAGKHPSDRAVQDAKQARVLHTASPETLSKRKDQLLASSSRRRSGGAAVKEPDPATGLDASVRNLFTRRVYEWTRSLAETAPAEVLAEALARPSARGSILHVLDRVPPGEEKSEVEILREKALQRGLAVREELTREAGGLKPTQWVAAHLNVRRQSVDRYRKEGRLLAWETPQGFVFPMCQFDAAGILPGLDEVLKEMGGIAFWEALAGLVTPTPTLGGKSVLDALRTGRTEDREKVLEVAHAYANE